MKLFTQPMWERWRQRSSTHLFATGAVVVTAPASHALACTGATADELIRRHASGDWGDIDELDVQQNKLGLRLGLRIRSSYEIGRPDKSARGSVTVWVITTPNRRTTTVLLPREVFDETSEQE